MPNDKKLKRLEALLDTFDAGAVQPDELIKAIDAVMAIIDQNGRTLFDKIIETKEINNKDIERVKFELNQAKQNLESIIEEVKNKNGVTLAEIKRTFVNEIKRVESLIPELPPETDLTEVFNGIESHKEQLEQLSVLIVGENIRNSLESLQGDDRLDKSAIRGLDELIDDLRKIAKSQQPQAVGVRLLRYLSDVNIEGITDGQGIAWNSTTQKFEPATLGGGSGFTELTATGSTNGTNVTFTFTQVPSYIVADGVWYKPTAKNGTAFWTNVGLTVTMVNPPAYDIFGVA